MEGTNEFEKDIELSLESNLKGKISQLESLLDTKLRIFTNREDYINANLNPKLLIQESKIIDLQVYNPKTNPICNPKADSAINLKADSSVDSVDCISVVDPMTDLFSQIIKFCGSIECLRLINWNIAAIPPEIVQLQNLKILDLQRNHIRTIPRYICQLHKLTHLDLSNNKIRKIPDFLCQLSCLEDLSLGNNEITVVPDNLCSLSHLEELFIGNNKITALPDNIGAMTKLKWLHVGGNKIAILPASLSKCTSLQRINVSNNPLVSLAGIPHSLSNYDVRIESSNLTFKGCFLSQFTHLESSIRHAYDYDVMNNRTPYITYHGPLSELPVDEIPRFIEELSGDFNLESRNIEFPSLPIPTVKDPLHRIYIKPLLPAFRTFLISFLEHIAEYNGDSWKDYYARHPVDIAQSYVKSNKSHKSRQSHESPTLNPDEFERLVHECDYRIYTLLKNNLSSLDPILLALNEKFSVKMGNQSLLL
ncbi:MAG: leucine-rich repeat domain-containing protein [Promethearchaeota archaeon]